MEPVEERINLWSDALAKRLIESRHFDLAEIKTVISSHLKLALHDCLKINISDIERQLNQKKMIASTLQANREDTSRIQKEIIPLKAKLKEQNVLRYNIEQIEKLGELIIFLKQKDPALISEFRSRFMDHLDKFSNPKHVLNS